MALHTPRTGLGQHLLDVDSLGPQGIERILDLAQRMSEEGEAHADLLRGRVMVNLFYEASTRTRVSFEVAAHRLGMHVLNISAAESSVTKGESLVDTVRTLDATGMDALVLRHPEAGAPYLASQHCRATVLNAGDGRHAHPTQALLDLLTLRQRFGTLAGLRVAIVGDLEHSRVARSTALGLYLCGARVRLCGPSTLLLPPGWLESLPVSERGGSVEQTTSLPTALEAAQVVMALRMQAERQSGGLLPALKEYVQLYGITREQLGKHALDALVMHPGPANEGVEIAPDLMASSESLIPEQVSNGVLVRMAVLRTFLGGGDE